ncbi:hypothetical protein M5W68_11480 [Paenibacillus larvae]|uniref:hypothetical protein n=1 Tax=Paenibacillus larvae TaxID=1464 RepID=UPI00227DC30B|nr:hypothetical protein [Paenibacillus larvae]MCY9512233.1 hypothetical protein [Paenibacillus larvae]MCY9525730.1 hypothetical protein [Paenibacillus larvae]
MFKFKKLILASLAVATMLTIAPMPSFAENTTIEVKQVPMNWGSIDFKKNANNQSVVTMDQDGEVTAQGWKKSVVVWGLRNGESAFHKITEWLGFGTKEAKYLKDNASKIADALERFESQVEQRLVDFMIFQCGIPQGSARVIAKAITTFIL